MPYEPVRQKPEKTQMSKEKKPLILAIDDEVHNLEILERILGSEYNLKLITSGEEALEFVFSGQTIDLILLDIMMPGMDGFETAQELKTHEDTRSIPIIFITGQMDPESIRKGFELGGQDYITKPYHVLELRARVATHLKLKRQQEELASINQHLELMVAERTKALQYTLSQKEALILELTHRVKNMLQMTISLLQLKLYDMKHEETQLALRDFLCSIQTISTVHNLTRGEEDLVRLPVHILLNQLIPLIKQRFTDTSQHINFKTNFEESVLHINSAIPLGLLTTEVLSSLISTKIGEKSNNTIGLTFSNQKDGVHKLEIEFRSMKISKSELETLKTKMKLANLLARQLHGDFVLNTAKSLVQIEFKEPELRTYNPYVEENENPA
jgi:CheY-like chemotaxis protein